MRTLPQLPYLQNIVRYYHRCGHVTMGSDHYREWLSQFGFQVPVRSFDVLEFPDDFSDRDMTLFMLRWS